MGVRSRLAIGLVLATVSANLYACASASVAPSTPAERLIAQPPQGWQQSGATSVGSLRRAEFRPEEELAEGAETEWTRRITFESLKEDPLPDPIEFVELMNAGRDYDCGTFRAHPTFAGEENGYPTAVYLLVCHQDRQTNRSEVTLMKTIRGNEYFYVITRALRDDPIPKEGEPAIERAEIGGWAIYLKSISVCDTSRPEVHPCPPPAEP